MANKQQVLGTRFTRQFVKDFDAWVAGVNKLRAGLKLEPLDRSKALRAVLTQAVKAGPVLLREDA